MDVSVRERLTIACGCSLEYRQVFSVFFAFAFARSSPSFPGIIKTERFGLQSEHPGEALSISNV